MNPFRLLSFITVFLLATTGFSQQRTDSGYVWPLGRADFDRAKGDWLSRSYPDGGYLDGYYHTGVDMMASLKAPVYAISGGKIKYASKKGWGSTNLSKDGWNSYTIDRSAVTKSSNGDLIQTNYCLGINHVNAKGEAFTAIYGHIQPVKISGEVKAGDIIGYVGSWQYGTHVHFGIYPGTNLPSNNWGMMPNSSWNNTNGFVDPIAYIKGAAPSGLPDGWYQADGEATVFLVVNKQRRALTTAECYDDWKTNSKYGSLHHVTAERLYSETAWKEPINYLVRKIGTPSVYWIVESFNDGTPTGGLVARPITSEAVFNGMNFDWNDVKDVSYDPSKRFKVGTNLKSVEPRLIVKDGPYAGFRNDTFYAGWRVRNMSNAAVFGLSITTRICHYNSNGDLDGKWLDFPWMGTGGIDKKWTDGWSPEWAPLANRKVQPRGNWQLKVIYSYRVNGKDIQLRAYTNGERPYPDSNNRMYAGS